MDIEHLEDLVAFSRTLSFSAAARERFMSQPALSQRIAKMEKELGFDLVTHGTRPGLTDTGKVFCTKIVPLLEQYRSAEQVCRTMQQRGASLRIVDLRSVCDCCVALSNILSDAGIPHVFYPQEQIPRLSETEALDLGIVDVSFIFEKDGSVVPFADDRNPYGCIKLQEEPLGVMFSPSHPLAGNNEISIDDLKGSEVVFTDNPLYSRFNSALQAKLDELGVAFKPLTAIGDSQAIVISNDPNCVSFFFRSAGKHAETRFNADTRSARIANPDLSLQPYAIFRKDSAKPAIKRLAALG